MGTSYLVAKWSQKTYMWDNSQSGRFRPWIPALGWALIIFALSSIPGSAIPEGPVPETDKLVHLALYGVLGSFCARALVAHGRAARTSKLILAAAILATGYGVTDEIHQLFTPRRSCDWHDVVADAIGGLLGAFVATRWLASRPAPGTPETQSEPTSTQIRNQP
jgi:VanZ family protein